MALTQADEEYTLALPASSANLGPAFDAAAVAWNRLLRVRARHADEMSVAARGQDAALCGEIRDHLVLSAYRSVLERAHQPVRPIELHLENEIPLGKGCGSSAAARLAGVALAAKLNGLGWTSQQVFEEAARQEGHPDNAAACWWGGFVVAHSGDQGSISWIQLPAAGKWPLLVVVPAAALATEAARRVLPATYSRADAVANVQNAMLLAAAWQQGRGDMLSAAMADRLHQPYRAPLCPLLPTLQPMAGSNGILSCCLSGAGPSVLLVVQDAAGARLAAQAALRQAGLEADILDAAVAARGPGLDWK